MFKCSMDEVERETAAIPFLKAVLYSWTFFRQLLEYCLWLAFQHAAPATLLIGRGELAIPCQGRLNGGNQVLSQERFLEDGHANRHVRRLVEAAGHK